MRKLNEEPEFNFFLLKLNQLIFVWSKRIFHFFVSNFEFTFIDPISSSFKWSCIIGELSFKLKQEIEKQCLWKRLDGN